jgi:FkbM family methyltransferase
MITLDFIFPEKNGIQFTSHFTEPRQLTAKFIDTYTQLCFWATEMEVYPYGSFFISYPRTTQIMTFLVEDSLTHEIFLKICDFTGSFPNDIKKLDIFGKLENIGKKISNTDLWSGLTLYEIFLENAYEHPLCKISDGDVVVDIGANLGLFSYWSILSGASVVHSFEPTPFLSKVIRETFEDLPIDSHNLAVWSNEKLLTLNTSRISIFNSIYVSVNNQVESIECQGVILENWARESDIKIDFLKIDCEGCEWEILPTMNPEFLQSISKIVLEYHIHQPDKLLEIFSDNGFTTEHNHNMIWAWRE